jgi:hypothetical protein
MFQVRKCAPTEIDTDYNCHSLAVLGNVPGGFVRESMRRHTDGGAGDFCEGSESSDVAYQERKLEDGSSREE